MLAQAVDPVPVYRFENVAATDGSIQQSLIFRARPGDLLRIECSEDLQTWTAEPTLGEEWLYSLGQELVIPVREFIPAPPAAAGAEPADAGLALAPTFFASLRIQPATGGGSVVSWASLADGSPLRMPIAGSTVAAWAGVPMVARRFGGFQFFIVCWGDTIPPPSILPTLGGADAALLACFEENLATLNSEVAASATTALAMPPPAPPASGERRLWRAVARETDTDGDRIADWMEFEMAADASHPSHALADPFNADANGNGIPDGYESDYDRDTVADALDAAPAERNVTTPAQPQPRYAVFPTASALAGTSGGKRALQISDRGTVVFPNGTWTSGVWTALPAGSFTSPVAYGINDSDEIVGSALQDLDGTGSNDRPALSYWSSPTANPLAVRAGSHYAAPTLAMGYHQSVPGPVIANDGRVIAVDEAIDSSAGGSPVHTLGNAEIWTLPGGGRTVARSGVATLHSRIAAQDSHWGWEPGANATTFTVPGHPHLPSLGMPVVNFLSLGEGLQGAFETTGFSQVLRSGVWEPGGLLARAIDLAASGVAIGVNATGEVAPLLMGDRWLTLDRTAPDLPEEWLDYTPAGTVLKDTTPGGWILATRGQSPAQEPAVMLPLRVSGTYQIDATSSRAHAAGVDDFSTGSKSYSPAVKDRIWIMAPQGLHTTRAVIGAPLNSSSRLKLAAANITLGGGSAITLDTPSTSVPIVATAAAVAGEEILLETSLTGASGDVASLSKPIGLKVMKARTLRVRIFLVTKSTPGEADLPVAMVPDEAELEAYLTGIFRPQLNLEVDVEVNPIPQAVDWDVYSRDGILDTLSLDEDHTTEQKAVTSTFAAAMADDEITFKPHISIFIIAAKKVIAGDAWGEANIEQRTCWVMGNGVAGKEPYPSALQSWIIAHEIGHVVFGAGHPSDYRTPGVAPLPGTDFTRRLMVQGSKKGPELGILIVKEEWDEAEKWMIKMETMANPIPF